MPRPLRLPRWMILLAMIIVAGCGAGTNRAAVRGRVTLDGKPLVRGAIRFIPAGNAEGPMAAAAIVNGDYRLDAENGPVIGELRVEIAADESDQLPYDIMDPAAYRRHGGVPRPRQPIPGRYNTNSELEATVRAEAENVLDYAVTTQ